MLEENDIEDAPIAPILSTTTSSQDLSMLNLNLIDRDGITFHESDYRLWSLSSKPKFRFFVHLLHSPHALSRMPLSKLIYPFLHLILSGEYSALPRTEMSHLLGY